MTDGKYRVLLLTEHPVQYNAYLWKATARHPNRANIPGSYLVFAGDGPLRTDLENEARNFGIAGHVRFLGFVNQTGLPQVYASSDVLVLPSEYEQFGLVMNEAMLCGCRAIVSDRVGAKYDLVRDGETGCVYPCADVGALAGILRSALGDLPKLAEKSRAASARIDTWTPEIAVEAFVECIEVAIRNSAAAARDPK